jgi:hypothetical protein
MPISNTNTTINNLSDTIRIRPESMDEKELYDKIVKLEEVGKNVKKYKKEEDKLKGVLKTLSLSEYLEEYKLTNENPGTIIIEAYNDGKKGEFMYLIGDKYITIKNENDANDLISKYGNTVIKKERTYTFNNEMVEKYSEVLSNMILESDEIEEEDKGSIYVVSEKYKVVNGAIDDLMNISENSNENIERIFEDIKPIETIKNTKIIKS